MSGDEMIVPDEFADDDDTTSWDEYDSQGIALNAPPDPANLLTKEQLDFVLGREGTADKVERVAREKRKKAKMVKLLHVESEDRMKQYEKDAPARLMVIANSIGADLLPSKLLYLASMGLIFPSKLDVMVAHMPIGGYCPNPKCRKKQTPECFIYAGPDATVLDPISCRCIDCISSDIQLDQDEEVPKAIAESDAFIDEYWRACNPAFWTLAANGRGHASKLHDATRQRLATDIGIHIARAAKDSRGCPGYWSYTTRRTAAGAVASADIDKPASKWLVGYNIDVTTAALDGSGYKVKPTTDISVRKYPCRDSSNVGTEFLLCGIHRWQFSSVGVQCTRCATRTSNKTGGKRLAWELQLLQARLRCEGLLYAANIVKKTELILVPNAFNADGTMCLPHMLQWYDWHTGELQNTSLATSLFRYGPM